MVNKMRKTGKKGKVTQAVLLILLFMAVAIAGYSGFRLWKYYHEYLEDQELYEDLRDEILQTPELETDTESVSELDTRKKYHKTSESEIPFDVDWDELKDINEDIIGWVYFTGLPQISYPVFSLRPDIGRRLKTCRFDLAVKKKSREKLCPIRTHAAKKVIKEGVCNEYLHSWDQRKRYKVT